jgi:salicylate hydroxylase
MNLNPSFWKSCPNCQGRGKKSQRIRKKARLNYERALKQFQKSQANSSPPTPPKGHLKVCDLCIGSGLIASNHFPVPDVENLPHVAIVGGGIGGVALAVACLHRGIPFTLFERDSNFNARSQGYGLTLQQASKAMDGFGIRSLDQGITSTRHVVHTTDGEILGEWGMRKWLNSESKKAPNKTNIHIARQSLRLALLEQLGNQESIKWNHQLFDFKETEDHKMQLTFQVNENLQSIHADLIVGADGIRSTVREKLLGDKITPLRYLDCMVILGICSLQDLENIESELLDSATVFQTANGVERMYMMPYDATSIMWQFSFPISEAEAKNRSSQGAASLKKETLKRTQNWHNPIPQIIQATSTSLVSGYPVYDRELLDKSAFAKAGKVTLLGDAAHPMSPFKGQGANQALLDSLSLARAISIGCRPQSNWKDKGIRKSALIPFEEEMLSRSASKVKDSAEAAQFLHSEVVLHEGDEPRGRVLKR